MSDAVDQQGPSVLRQHLALNDVRREGLAHCDPFRWSAFVFTPPSEWADRQARHGSAAHDATIHSLPEQRGGSLPPAVVRAGWACVVSSQIFRRVSHGTSSAAHEPVGDILMECISKLDDDVVHNDRKPRIESARQKGMGRCSDVRRNANDLTCLEGVENTGNGLSQLDLAACATLRIDSGIRNNTADTIGEGNRHRI